MATLQDLIAQGYTPEQAASLMGKSGGNSAVLDAINATAARAGMDPKYWTAIGSIESSLNPSSNYNRGTQYKGLFQVGSDEWRRKGGGGDIYNPMDNARAAAELAADNNAKFQAQFGRAPTPIETYMMHQQGFGFYKNGTMTNIEGNPYPGMSGPQTPQSFEAGWARELERRAGNPNYQHPTEGSVAPARGMASTAGSIPTGATASAAGSTTPAQNASTGTDFASAMGAIRDRIAKEEEANAPAPLPPMQMAQPMMTPAMMRARMMVQAMFNKDRGIS